MGSSQHDSSRGFHASAPWRALRAFARVVDQRRGWDRLPLPLSLVVLIGLRDSLRRDNLYDPADPASYVPPAAPPTTVEAWTTRTVDGSSNDLDDVTAGMAGRRFGRNVPPSVLHRPTRDEVLHPSPREVSRALMTRVDGRMVEAPGANALVSAWLQFMIRDWFSHGPSVKDDPWEVDLVPGDAWPRRTVTVLRTMPDPTVPPGTQPPFPTSVNTCTHWWDASQVYGTTTEYQQMTRTHVGGKLVIGPDGRLPVPQGEDGPTKEPGFWVGLAMLQTLFTLEHNAICDMLNAAYPSWSDEQTFQRARLVLAAVTAKIHTVEWTPVVIGHPTTKFAMRANWFGLQGERLHRRFGRLSKSEVISGIPGSELQSYGVPYSLTEEFAAVYRMHPLVRDWYDLRSVRDDSLHARRSLRDLSGQGGVDVLSEVSLEDLFYSFGTEQPGVVTLHNFPHFLQEFERPDNGEPMDLAATDILRHREMGVPRYCEFRRQLRLRAPRSFSEITDDVDAVREMKRIYGPDGIERLDLMVGLFAERRPEGFAFSDTAFRIFILMASRRLNSDRFFTTDYRPEVYTRQGMRWIADASMASLLRRHYPALAASIGTRANAFELWDRART
ncbi:heme peroxidase [Motilibacter peucedani]|uniref:Heme peroxidase n=1 Tax=Motilibacter peucedani TaxID=598650 RepID=A0A420XP79_9ACTN|nr:peroxidase family protein [Motilibacter peucedani]RKS73976.1 heme peroxidase [Motilibacter peucedani]